MCTSFGNHPTGIHSASEYAIETISGYARSFRNRIKTCQHSSYSQAYAILTLCRALYTRMNGEQISKPAAAHWAMEFLPEHADIIKNALIWRSERDFSTRNPLETYLLAERFVIDVISVFF